jgi:hypothetical protein
MVSFLKSLQAIFQSIIGDLPDGVRLITEFVWKIRWFIVSGFVLYALYTIVMVALPYLMWSFVIKMILSAVIPFIF